MSRMLIAATILSMFVLEGCQSADGTRVTSVKGQAVVEIHGHRAWRGRYAEQSFFAFKRALQEKVPTIEFDVVLARLSESTDTLIVNHDVSLEKKIASFEEGEGPVADLLRSGEEVLFADHSVADIRRGVDIGRKAYSFKGQRSEERLAMQIVEGAEASMYEIPTLEEVLDLVVSQADYEPTLNIEIKSVSYSDTQIDNAIRILLDLIEDKALGKRSLIQSFDLPTLVRARELIDARAEQGIDKPRLVLLLKPPSITGPREPTDLSSPEEVAEFLASHMVAELARPEVISPFHGSSFGRKLIDADTVDALQRAGYKVVPWTANGEADWRRLLEYGVDGIITDYPIELKAFLER